MQASFAPPAAPCNCAYRTVCHTYESDKFACSACAPCGARQRRCARRSDGPFRRRVEPLGRTYEIVTLSSSSYVFVCQEWIGANSSVQTIWSRDCSSAAVMIDKGDTAWVLVCSAFVLLMTVPGLAFFYGGWGGKKNFWRPPFRPSPVSSPSPFRRFPSDPTLPSRPPPPPSSPPVPW